MKPRTLTMLITAAFLLGDLEACIRANRLWKSYVSALEKENELLHLKMNYNATFLRTMVEEGSEPEEVHNQLSNQRKFIEILEEGL